MMELINGVLNWWCRWAVEYGQGMMAVLILLYCLGILLIWLQLPMPDRGPVGDPFPGFWKASYRFCTGMPRWRFYKWLPFAALSCWRARR